MRQSSRSQTRRSSSEIGGSREIEELWWQPRGCAPPAKARTPRQRTSTDEIKGLRAFEADWAAEEEEEEYPRWSREQRRMDEEPMRRSKKQAWAEEHLHRISSAANPLDDFEENLRNDNDDFWVSAGHRRGQRRAPRREEHVPEEVTIAGVTEQLDAALFCFAKAYAAKEDREKEHEEKVAKEKQLDRDKMEWELREEYTLRMIDESINHRHLIDTPSTEEEEHFHAPPQTMSPCRGLELSHASQNIVADLDTTLALMQKRLGLEPLVSSNVVEETTTGEDEDRLRKERQDELLADFEHRMDVAEKEDEGSKRVVYSTQEAAIERFLARREDEQDEESVYRRRERRHHQSSPPMSSSPHRRVVVEEHEQERDVVEEEAQREEHAMLMRARAHQHNSSPEEEQEQQREEHAMLMRARREEEQQQQREEQAMLMRARRARARQHNRPYRGEAPPTDDTVSTNDTFFDDRRSPAYHQPSAAETRRRIDASRRRRVDSAAGAIADRTLTPRERLAHAKNLRATVTSGL